MDLQVEQGDGACVVRVSGEMDADTAYDVYSAAVEQSQRCDDAVILDLADVQFIDSVGLGMLIRTRDELQLNSKARLTLRDPSERVRRLLELTALTSAFEIVG